MSATDTRLRGRTRWSAASKCPRWAALGLLGTEPSEPTERQQRIWRRGRQLGADRALMFIDRYGPENVIREKAVPWPANGLPLGELHTDVFVIPEKLAVEVKSSTSPASILDSAIVQLAGEVHFDQEAENGALMIVDPTGYQEDILIPVMLTDELVGRVEQIAADVANAAKGGALPDCACASPGGCRMMGCPFTDESWKDYEAPEFLPLDGRKAELARDLYQTMLGRREHEAISAEKKARAEEIQHELLELGCKPGEHYMIGPLKLKCFEMPGRVTFSLAGARKTNLWTAEDDDRFRPFIKAGDGHMRWTVERVGDEPLMTAADFGDDVPF